MTEQHYIGVDIGGTFTKIGLVSDRLELIDTRSIPTGCDRTPDALVNDIVKAVNGLCPTQPAAIGVGCPGPLSPSKGIVHKAPNLPTWDNVPLRYMFNERTGVPTVIANDANVAALGQYVSLPADERADLVVLTLGTGIGSGTIIHGRIFSGYHESGSEWGHCIVEVDGRPCPCGQRGCLEQYASASAVAAIAREKVWQGHETAISSGISAETVAKAGQKGDALAAEIWSDACGYLAIAIVNIQHAINPRYVFLGGGMSQAGDYLLDTVIRHFRDHQWSAHSDQPIIQLAPLANTAGMIGAAAVAQQHVTTE